jgi:hypothetical protein
MFARRIATLVCLFSAVCCFGGPEHVTPVTREVVVYVKTVDGQPTQPLDEMKREAAVLMETAGYRIAWRNLRESAGMEVESSVVVLELRGICDVPQSPAARLPGGSASLASTAVVNGEVLPFAWLECETLSRLLGPALEKYDSKQDFLYGRAMGRLVAHELYHILAKTREHGAGGIAKTSFSAKDVLSDRFHFDLTTLAKLREPVSASDDATAGGLEETGR